MSKGLGKLQREIIDSLDAAMQTPATIAGEYRGDARQAWVPMYVKWQDEPLPRPDTWRWDKPGWITYHGKRVRLAPWVYDMRAVLKYLATKNDKNLLFGRGAIEAYQASFSRAVRGLVERGILVADGLVHVVEWEDGLDEINQIMRLQDGDYINVIGRRLLVRPEDSLRARAGDVVDFSHYV